MLLMVSVGLFEKVLYCVFNKALWMKLVSESLHGKCIQLCRELVLKEEIYDLKLHCRNKRPKLRCKISGYSCVSKKVLSCFQNGTIMFPK